MHKRFNTAGVTRFHAPVFLDMDAMPVRTALRLQDHSVLLAHAAGTMRADLITGVTGLSARDQLLYSATQHAVRTKCHALTLEWEYWRTANKLVRREEKLARAENKNKSVTELEVVHIGQISKAQRQELHSIILDWFPQLRTLQTSLHELLLENPVIVQKTLDEFPSISCVIYPARLAIKTDMVVWVGTMRFDRARIQGARLLHLPDVQVEV